MEETLAKRRAAVVPRKEGVRHAGGLRGEETREMREVLWGRGERQGKGLQKIGTFMHLRSPAAL